MLYNLYNLVNKLVTAINSIEKIYFNTKNKSVLHELYPVHKTH